MSMPTETFEEKLVTYTQEIEGKFVVIEHVPARVCRETGEQLFSPKTVSRIQALIKEARAAKRIIETPFYEFAESTPLG
jgi:YgiT-type zinc finger domain-containing protein